MRQAPDQSLFIVVQSHGRFGLQSVTDPDVTREGIVRDIFTGQLPREKIEYIVECNPRENWARDITHSILEAVDEIRHRAGDLVLA